jgi:hypothetical protein
MSEARSQTQIAQYDAEMERYFEQQAGLVMLGPDGDTVDFTLNGKTYAVNYVVVHLGGLASQEIARNELIRYVMSREFTVLGNAIRLQRTSGSGPMGMPPAEEGYPQGPILVWRQAPHFHCSDAGIWDAETSYAVLPPFVAVEHASVIGSGGQIWQMAPESPSGTPQIPPRR